MPTEVVLYTRRGCHLCDEMKSSLLRLRRRAEFTLHEVDIDTDSDLSRQFNDEVPVLFIGDRKAFKYHLNEDRFLRLLAGGSDPAT